MSERVTASAAAAIAARLRGHAALAAGTSGPATPLRLTLVVDDPIAVAAHCWDEGLTVLVEELADGDARLVVADPRAGGGIRVALVAEDRSE